MELMLMRRNRADRAPIHIKSNIRINLLTENCSYSTGEI